MKKNAKLTSHATLQSLSLVLEQIAPLKVAKARYHLFDAMPVIITLLNLTISVFCILSCLAGGFAQQQKAFTAPEFGKSLTFRHIYHHASYSGKYPGMFRRMDFSEEQAMVKADLMEKPLRFDVKQTIGRQYRPGSPLPHLMKAAQTPRQMHYAMGIHNMKLDYGILPNVKDRQTVLALAQMTNNAYSDPDTREDWYDLGTKWNVVG